MNRLLTFSIGFLYLHQCNGFVPSFMPFRTQMTFGATLEGRLIEGEIKPTNNFVLVKIADAIEKTEGGIILAGKVRESICMEVEQTLTVFIYIYIYNTHLYRLIFFCHVMLCYVMLCYVMYSRKFKKQKEL